jgi:glucose uptake protein
LLVPSTHQTALLLLIVGLVCLGSWANTFKSAKWRYELYYLDFALGALALAIAAAFTFGTLGSELSFNDRIAVAGLRSQAFAVAAGVVFTLGNMLLVAGVALVGLAVAFPLTLSLAFLIGAYFEGMGRLAFFCGGAALLVISCFGAATAAKLRSAPKAGSTPQAAKARRSRATKGIIVGLIGGVLIGASAPLADASFWGDLGLGAYAGLLMFCIGLTGGALGFDLFLMNIGIEGGRVTFGDYRAGAARQHLLGLLGGAIWALGMLTVLLAQSTPVGESPAARTVTIFVQSATLLAVLWGLAGWKELAAPAKARTCILLSLITFAAAIGFMALRQTGR